MSNAPHDLPSPQAAEGKRFRFSLRTLFFAVTVCAVACFLLTQLLWPAIMAAREADRRTRCVNNLKQLGVGLHNYNDVYKVFPAAYVPDFDGKPMHSWRMSAAPFIASSRWMDMYDWRLPWDDPANLRLTIKLGWFVCPHEPIATGGSLASYVMIVGDEAAIRPGKWTQLSELDDRANTIVVAEIADSNIFLAEPRDLEFDKMSYRINDPAGNSISSHHPGGAHVVMADGSVRFLANDTEPALVRALCTRDAGDNPQRGQIP